MRVYGELCCETVVYTHPKRGVWFFKRSPVVHPQDINLNKDSVRWTSITVLGVQFPNQGILTGVKPTVNVHGQTPDTKTDSMIFMSKGVWGKTPS